ncbi:exopolysaccharide biosynthesis polyprenyl glycosylphosphotransferase, partial [Halobacteriales archaeon QH_6_64_20]
VERAVLAFGAPDRTAFFRALAACHSHGVSVTAHRECAESVLTKDEHSDFVDIDLEPWHWTNHILKTLFDKAFALAGLLVLAPLMLAIAVAIKLDSPGPVLYSQDRTTTFGETFRLYKFRTMTPRSGDTTPVDDEENVHITRVGRLLRRTHLDEIPQLYSILAGDMSTVLAQVNEVSSTNPELKLHYDIEYIRHQSFGLDVKIVSRQIRTVLMDLLFR